MEKSRKVHFVFDLITRHPVKEENAMRADSGDLSSSSSAAGAEGDDALDEVKVRFEKDEAGALERGAHSLSDDGAERVRADSCGTTAGEVVSHEKVPDRKLVLEVLVDEGRVLEFLAPTGPLKTSSCQESGKLNQAVFLVIFSYSRDGLITRFHISSIFRLSKNTVCLIFVRHHTCGVHGNGYVHQCQSMMDPQTNTGGRNRFITVADT